MAEKLFDAGMIAAWETALGQRPRDVTELEWPALPQVEAFSTVAMNAGMAIRLRGRDGAELSFVINPVAARDLALSIFHKGVEAGWLTQTGTIVAPDRPPFDS